MAKVRMPYWDGSRLWPEGRPPEVAEETPPPPAKPPAKKD